MNWLNELITSATLARIMASAMMVWWQWSFMLALGLAGWLCLPLHTRSPASLWADKLRLSAQLAAAGGVTALIVLALAYPAFPTMEFTSVAPYFAVATLAAGIATRITTRWMQLATLALTATAFLAGYLQLHVAALSLPTAGWVAMMLASAVACTAALVAWVDGRRLSAYEDIDTTRRTMHYTIVLLLCSGATWLDLILADWLAVMLTAAIAALAWRSLRLLQRDNLASLRKAARPWQLALPITTAGFFATWLPAWWVLPVDPLTLPHTRGMPVFPAEIYAALCVVILLGVALITSAMLWYLTRPALRATVPLAYQEAPDVPLLAA